MSGRWTKTTVAADVANADAVVTVVGDLDSAWAAVDAINRDGQLVCPVNDTIPKLKTRKEERAVQQTRTTTTLCTKSCTNKICNDADLLSIGSRYPWVKANVGQV